MPQMAPMYWLILFMFFMMMFFFILNIIYFIFIKSNKIQLMNLINPKNYNKFI
uniref:F-ATPase subunit 8 n=1 Tax=Baizongia pistaciae TaxID=198322 RepID=B5WZ23_BAIPI|nr:F-ATPase subunit 8 [Baizongia pistaciae]